MEHEEILTQYRLNPDTIVSYIEALESQNKAKDARIETLESRDKAKDARIEALESQVIELQERINELESLLNWIQGKKKRPSNGAFSKKKLKIEISQKGSIKRPGGQKGHPGSTLNKVEDPDEIIFHRLHECKYCGHKLEESEIIGYKTRQEFNIVVKRKVTEHRAEIKKCPYCKCKNEADFPKSITKPVQYGVTVLSTAIYLRNYQLIPYNRIKNFFGDVFGLKISSGTIIKAEKKLYHRLKGVTNHIKKKLIKEYVIHGDETGINVNGRNEQCHLISTKKYTYYFHHKSRGFKAMNKMGVLPKYRGIVVHDFWKSYFKYKCEHALCNVHIQRELDNIYKKYNQKWAKEMSDLLYEIKEQADCARKLRTKIDEDTIKTFVEKYHSILMKGFEDNPPPEIPKDDVVKRGIKAQSKPKNLLDRLAKHEKEILRFAMDLRVPFSNNQAERDLRMITVQQKISGNFRKPRRADVFCRIRGYISTLIKNNMPVIGSLDTAIEDVPPLP
jgi:transposase